MNWDDEEETLWQRHRWLLPVIVTSVGGGVAFAFSQVKMDTSPAPVRAPERMVSITLPPLPKPPPPPPPKPPEQKPEEQKEEMIEQEKVEEPEEKPEAPKDDPPPALGTGIKGDGVADGFGLSGSGNGMIGGSGNGNGSGRKRGSAFGWYASQVQSSIADAVRRNGKTKFASGQRDVRIWVDSTGRVTRASVSGGSGEADVNLALNNEVLAGLQLREAPPSNMPMPIVLRINAQRPN